MSISTRRISGEDFVLNSAGEETFFSQESAEVAQTFQSQAGFYPQISDETRRNVGRYVRRGVQVTMAGMLLLGMASDIVEGKRSSAASNFRWNPITITARSPHEIGPDPIAWTGFSEVNEVAANVVPSGPPRPNLVPLYGQESGQVAQGEVDRSKSVVRVVDIGVTPILENRSTGIKVLDVDKTGHDHAGSMVQGLHNWVAQGVSAEFTSHDWADLADVLETNVEEMSGPGVITVIYAFGDRVGPDLAQRFFGAVHRASEKGIIVVMPVAPNDYSYSWLLDAEIEQRPHRTHSNLLIVGGVNPEGTFADEKRWGAEGNEVFESYLVGYYAYPIIVTMDGEVAEPEDVLSNSYATVNAAAHAALLLGHGYSPEKVVEMIKEGETWVPTESPEVGQKVAAQQG